MEKWKMENGRGSSPVHGLCTNFHVHDRPALFSGVQPGVPPLAGHAIAEVGAADNSGSMLWFFERQDSRLRYEIRSAENGQGLELVITYPDGREEVEVYATPADALRRSDRLQRDLTAAGWQSPCSKFRGGATADVRRV